jgi:hypothetical protein
MPQRVPNKSLSARDSAADPPSAVLRLLGARLAELTDPEIVVDALSTVRTIG